MVKMDSKTWKETIIEFLENNRALVVLIFCLPASFIFDIYLKILKFINIKYYGSLSSHDKRVREIQTKVLKWSDIPKEERKFLCTARANWLSLSTTFFRKDLCHKIPINLYNILELDEKNLTIRVEPMVTVGDITKYLIPKGYTLAVTLELAEATLGGLAFGAGMTTHSHKVGLYHENIVSYEVVLADGSFMIVSKEDHPDLYNTLMWSHGSLAFLVALTVKVVKIKPYLKITYTPVEGQKEYCDAMRKVSGANSKDDVVSDYVEMTIYSKNKAVIMTGDYSDYDHKLPVNNITKWYKPWFYKYVATFSKKGRTHTELIPLREYLLRHDRAIFWVVECMLPFGNNPLFRLLFGWLLPPKPAFLKFTTTPGVRAYTFARQIFQDIVLPINELEQQINISEKLFDLYPLLVYPCKVYDHGRHANNLPQPQKKYLVSGTDYAIYNDLGIYGVPGFVKRKEKYNPVSAMREMERFTREIGGFSFLYADIFMTKDELLQMFDLKLYEAVRRKYGAEGAFPHLYDKVKPEIDVMKIGQEYEIK